MTVLNNNFELSNGVTIPSIGFGTWQIPDGEVAYDSVAAAIKAGYRHIDTARAYGNEASVGKAIADSGIPRDEIFLTTKIPAEVKTYDGAIDAFEKSIAALGTDYVDLLLIHAPWPWQDMGSEHDAGNAEVWRAMEEFHAAGRTRSIGVSNFLVSHIEKLLETAKVTPHANQIRFYIGDTQQEVTEYCQAKGILVEGYSPLATGAILGNEDVAAIAKKYDVSVAQLCIRYVLQKGVLPLPKTTNAGRMVENAAVDFVIADADMAYLDGLTDTKA